MIRNLLGWLGGLACKSLCAVLRGSFGTWANVDVGLPGRVGVGGVERPPSARHIPPARLRYAGTTRQLAVRKEARRRCWKVWGGSMRFGTR